MSSALSESHSIPVRSKIANDACSILSICSGERTWPGGRGLRGWGNGTSALGGFAGRAARGLGWAIGSAFGFACGKVRVILIGYPKRAVGRPLYPPAPFPHASGGKGSHSF